MKRQKPSGAHFRKKRKGDEEKQERSRDSPLKYLSSTPATTGSTAASTSTLVPSDGGLSDTQPGSSENIPTVPSTSDQPVID